MNEIEKMKQELNDLKKIVDENKDGKISVKEIKDFVVKVAMEYVYLYVALVLTIIGILKPDDIENWKLVFSIALSFSSVIFGGYLKSTFQKQLNKEKYAKLELEETNSALRDALSKATMQNEILKQKNEFESQLKKE